MASGRIERAQELVELWNSGNFEKWLDEVGSDFEFTPDPIRPAQRFPSRISRSCSSSK